MSPVREEPNVFMARLPMFMEFSQQEMVLLATVFDVRRLAEGEVLWKEGEASMHFAIVAEGSVGVFKELGGGKRHRMGNIGQGRLLGQLGLVDGGKRESTLMAERGGCIALMCRRDDFERLFTTNNPFAYKLLDFVVTDLSQRLREALNSMDAIVSNPTQLSALLLEKLQALGRSVHESGEIPMMVVKGGTVRPVVPAAPASSSSMQRLNPGTPTGQFKAFRPDPSDPNPGSNRRQ